MAEKLARLFREKVSKCKDERMKREAEPSLAYPTGFLGLDYLNGTVIHVKSETRDFKYNSIGLLDGCATTIIGRSGCGKTTLLEQIAANIIRPFKTSCVFLDDIEGGSNDKRLEVLFKMDPNEIQERLIYRNTGITTENIHDRIKMIRDMKIENRTEYEYDTGLFDSRGNRIFKLEPTVYIVDSIPLIMPDKIGDDDEIGGNMSASSMAKSNTALFKKITQYLKEANIIMLCINHIMDDIQINPFAKKKGQLSYLKQGERLPGGKAAIYLANNMIRVDDGAKLKCDEAFGIDGAIVELQMVKSRTNKTGKTVPLVFNYETGFDPDLSLFQLLKANGKINGTGVSFYIGNRNDLKFSQRNFKERLLESEELRHLFAEACYEELVKLLSVPEEISTEDVFDSDVSSLLLAMNTKEA